jgi:hypothetical protein
MDFKGLILKYNELNNIEEYGDTLVEYIENIFKCCDDFYNEKTVVLNKIVDLMEYNRSYFKWSSDLIKFLNLLSENCTHYKICEFFKKNKYSEGYFKNVIVDWIFDFMEDGEFDNIVVKEARYFLYLLL